jgi:voltage-gated potassium channel Kch
VEIISSAIVLMTHITMSNAIAMGLLRVSLPPLEASCWVLGKVLNWGYSLLGRVVDKADTLADVALKTVGGLGQERLLLLGNALQGVDGLLGTIGLCYISKFV